jgi:hypothetical protein
MADYPRITGTIRPTPRNRVSGFLADLLELGAKGYDVGSTLQAGGPITEGRLSTPVSDLLGIPELQRTLNRISYNEPLTTGTGYTTKLRPDTVSAAMTVAPMVGPTAKAGAAGARMAGTALKDLATSDVAYNAAMNAMRRSGGLAELTAYHGTPHRFAATERNPLGEFRSSQIGTGEGNQSYGHGLYIAEHPDVGTGYRKRLSASTYIKDSKPVESGMLWHKAADAASEIGGLHPDNAGRIASEIMDWIDAGKKPETFLKRNLVSEKLKPAYEAAIGQYAGSMRNKGSLYHVDLPDPMIEKMLHWDKPLEEQSPYVQKIISEEIKRIGGSAHTGQQAYRNLMFEARMAGKRSGSQEMRGNVEAAEASKRLQELGIPGIQYFDAGSRGSGGTRNFVVFPGEEKNLTILKRE